MFADLQLETEEKIGHLIRERARALRVQEDAAWAAVRSALPSSGEAD